MRWSPNATRLAAAFLTGMACSLWLFPIIAGPRVQQLRLERDKAVAEAESLNVEVEKLKESLSRRQAPPSVKAVALTIEAPDDSDRVKLEAQNQLKKELSRYVGRTLDEVSPRLLYTQLQGRLMKIDGVAYQLDIRLMSVGSQLELYAVLVPLKLD